MREITTHKIDGIPDGVTVRAGGPGDGYTIVVDERDTTIHSLCKLHFQKGSPAVDGFNGITMEALIAVCLDRLEVFQKGAACCPENERAREGLAQAMEALHARSRNRASVLVPTSTLSLTMGNLAGAATVAANTFDVPPPLPWSDIAAAAYAAYGAATGNKNYQGLPMPAWADLTPIIRTAWEAAAYAAAAAPRAPRPD